VRDELVAAYVQGAETHTDHNHGAQKHRPRWRQCHTGAAEGEQAEGKSRLFRLGSNPSQKG